MNDWGGASFAELLRGLRESRALTQEELAERSGLTVKAIGALERGERLRPYPHTVRSLSEALRLDDADHAALVASVPSRRQPAKEAVASPDPSLPSGAALPSPTYGRDHEVAAIRALLYEGKRLVTLTGPGGVGKTRLALEVLSQVADEIAEVKAVVDLSAIREPSMVLPRIAAALGIPETGSSTTAGLVPFLAGRRVLVMLDNLEQLLACAPVVADLVSQCLDLVVLATSRAPLRVRAEWEVKLAPLALPEDDALETVTSSPAVRMFLDRAEAAGAPLAVTPENASTVASICRRLDGLPLALELAAARAGLLTPAALLARLDSGVLDPGPRDLPDRQRTLGATLDWSHGLLDPAEQLLFAQLAVFGGGFSLDSLEAVVEIGEDVVPRLGALLDQSLVLRVETPDSQPRFRLLEPVRQYAADRLRQHGLATATADRHADHMYRQALAARSDLHGANLVECLDRLEADHANVRSGYLRLLETGRSDAAATLAGSLWLYLALRGHAREGLRWLERLDNDQLSSEGRCYALTGAAGLLFVTGDIARMSQAAQAGLTAARLLDNDALRAEVATLAGHAAVFAGDPDEAGPLLEEALHSAQSVAEAWATAHALVAQGQLALLAGDLDAADTRLLLAEGEARALGNAFTLATALNRRATVTELRGDHRTTAALLGESTDLSVTARIGWTLGYSLPALAGVAVRLGQARSAARLFGASASLSVSHSVDPRFPVSSALSDRNLAAVRDQLGDDDFRRSWDAGRVATGVEIAELACELRQLAHG